MMVITATATIMVKEPLTTVAIARDLYLHLNAVMTMSSYPMLIR